MLRVLAYIWSVFGAYWIIFAPVISAPAISYIRKASPSPTIAVNFSGRYICATAVDSASHSAYLANDRGARVGGVRVVLGRSAKRLPVWRVPVLSLAAFVGRDDRVCTSLLAENWRFHPGNAFCAAS